MGLAAGQAPGACGHMTAGQAVKPSNYVQRGMFECCAQSQVASATNDKKLTRCRRREAGWIICALLDLRTCLYMLWFGMVGSFHGASRPIGGPTGRCQQHRLTEH